MNKIVIICFLLFPIEFIYSSPSSSSSSIEITYFGNIDNPIPKLIITESVKDEAVLDFETKKGFRLDIQIQEEKYNKILHKIMEFPKRTIPSTSSYFIFLISDELYYFFDFKETIEFIHFSIAIIEKYKIIDYLIDYTKRIEILYNQK
jgi:hypothetical protein